MACINEKDDDFFGDLEDDDHVHQYTEEMNSLYPTGDGLSMHDCRANQARFRTMGYHEAYEITKDDELQKGFEDGYRQSIDVSFQIGERIGAIATCLRTSTAQSQKQELQATAEHVTKKIFAFSDRQSSHYNASIKASDIFELKQEIEELDKNIQI